MPLSARAITCLKKAGVGSLLELSRLSEDDLPGIRDMGAETRREIMGYIESSQLSAASPDGGYWLENVSLDNLKIPLPLLRHVGVSQEGIMPLLREGIHTVEDLCLRKVPFQECFAILPAVGFLPVSVFARFKEGIDSLNDSARACVLGRCDGATLQEIGDETGVSRERVRQIVEKACRDLRNAADLVAGVLFGLRDNSFAYADLQNMLGDEQAARCCKLVLQGSEYAMHFRFSERFFPADICPPDTDRLLAEFALENIGEGVNFSDNLESIEAGLAKRSLGFFDFEDIMNYLVHNGYRFYGGYVSKGAKSYGYVCHDAVKKFFPFDIKLNDDENNEDMRRLRQIMARHYQGLEIPRANKALTATLTRDSTRMVLSGRGRYCPFDKVRYNAALLDEVRQFILSSEQTSFYYGELYSYFEGRLLAETNINNFHFLHGMLKCLFPNEFVYERDLLVKTGSARQDVNDRLIQLFKQHKRALKKSEIMKAIPGINDFVIGFSASRAREVIQWDYNEYNHIENITACPEDINSLREIIKIQNGKHSGYCSESLLYMGAKENCRGFLERNRVENAQNLFYIASYFLGDEYRFKRPHIAAADFPARELSGMSIMQALLETEKTLNYIGFGLLAQNLGWPESTQTQVFNELEKNYKRVSEDDYVRDGLFSVPRDAIRQTSRILGEMTKSSGFHALGGTFDFGAFPKCGFQWNGFLLETIINEYSTGFRIIYPQIRHRKIQRGVIVPDKSPHNSFDELVVDILRKAGIHSISESGLAKMLKQRGIIAKTLPCELYKSSGMRLENETFFIDS